jgi:hypothetical protein
VTGVANPGLENIARSLIAPLLSRIPAQGPGFALLLPHEKLVSLALGDGLFKAAGETP